MAGTTTTQSIEVPVSLALDAAIRQADNLKRILKESVKPDSSAYREIDNMLSKASRQAQGFKQTMSESMKTSSGSKAFTNNLQKTFNLLDLVTERLSSVKGKDLIFSDEDTARLQQINTQINQTREQIKQLRTEKVGSLFNDSSIPEFKQLQDLAVKLHKNLSDLTFNDLNSAIERELKNVDNTITETTDKIKNLDTVLKNTNLSDLNKITQGLKTQGAANTIEVFKADNLTEAAQRLQAFYQQYSDYTGKMKSKIQEGTSVSKVLEDENKAINSNLSTQIAHLSNYKTQLEEALSTLKGISGHKAGQSREYKREILNSQSMQDLFKSVGFDETLAQTGDPNGFVMHAREAISQALSKVTVDIESFTNLRTSMLEGLKTVFEGLEVQQVIGDNKGFQNSLANWLSGGGVDLKNSGIVQAFNEIKKGSDVTTVINSIAAAVMQYVQSVEQAKTVATEEIQQQNAYAESLRNAQNAVQQGKQATEERIQALQEEILVLKQKIDLLEQNNENKLNNNVNSDEINEEAQAYKGLIAQLNTYTGALAKTEAQVRTLGNIRTAITNWMGFNQILNLVKRAVTEAMNHIKQLDATMNGIAIVTDMTTADLWKQVDAYSEMAQKFGVTIQGAYEVSKIYYQAGYDTNEVLTLTNETLKLSKISGLDYATTTDYMMTAMRGFKLEMEDASRVVDVYSNLAANTAVSQQELAEAMTRTASSMESVGATFEETSAMIATMVAVTRESASNIGSAMKSIASRYGELTKDPAALFDADGEAMSFNKVDTALRSVGITLQTTDHQFRDFTEVIIELAEKWDTLDSTAQRYIATQFAGNRQQSRFLALVSNVDLLKENIANAQNSEDIGTLQALETLDGLEAKINQVQVAYQQFYTTIGVENVWKGFLDGAKSVIDTLNSLPKLFEAIPLNAVAVIGSAISLVKTIALQGVAQIILGVKSNLQSHGKEIIEVSGKIGEESGKRLKLKIEEETRKINLKDTFKKQAGDIVNSIGSVGVMVGAVMDKTTKSGREAAGVVTGLGGAFQMVGGIVNSLVSGNWVGAILTVATGVINIVNGVSIAVETSTEKLERLMQEAENLNNEAKKVKAEYNTFSRSLDKIKELKKERNDSVEATEAYIDAVNELADSFPQLIIGFDEAGNAIIDVQNAEELLAEARRKTAEATLNATKGEIEANKAEQDKIAESAASSLDNLLYDSAVKVQKQNNNGIFDGITAFSINRSNDINTNARMWAEYLGLNTEQRTGDNWKMLQRLGFSSAIGSYEYTSENIDSILQLAADINQDYINGNTIWEPLIAAESEWNKYIEQIRQIIPLQRVNSNLERSAISQTLNAKYGEQLDNGLLNQLTTSLLINKDMAFSDLTDTDYAEATDAVINWWETLGENQEAATDIFKNLYNYSWQDVSNLLDLDTADKEVYDAISQYYGTQVPKGIAESIKAKAESVGAYGLSEILDSGAFNSQLGQSLVTQASDLVSNYSEQGLWDTAGNFIYKFMDIFTTLGSISEIDTEAFVGIEKVLSKGFSTKEQIQSVIDIIQSDIDDQVYIGDIAQAATEIITLLNDMQSQMVYNYIAALKASYGNNIEKYKSDQKTLSKLSKGMDIDEVYEFLTSSLNTLLEEPLNIDAFQVDASGNYKLDNSRLEQYWNEYIDKTYAINDDIKTFYESLADGFDANELLNNADALTTLGFDLTKEEEITSDDINKAVEEFQKAYELADDQVIRLKEQMTAQLHMNLGEYEEFLGELSLTEFASFKFGKNDLIKREAQKTLNEAYSNLISDAFSKGIENLNLADYTGLIKGQEIQTTGIKYQEFVEKYIGYTGKTLEEINELVVQAIEKDNAPTQGVKELLKDITFINQNTAYASLDTIRQLADIFQQDVRTMFDPDSFNELLGGYKITNFDFSGIKDAELLVADSIQEFFESLANLIGKGLDGKLSNVEFNNLQQMLKSFNLSIDLDFTKTAEGLKLSTDSAATLYARLNEIDTLGARLIFDDLADSFTKAGEVCENISSTLAEIAKIEAQLPNTSGKENQVLQDRLAIYKEIANSQMSDPNQYKFMDRDMPNGMQGPENYWNAVGKAYTAMNNAKSSGYMEIQDFYNIVNEMANLVEMSGGRVELMGMNFENAAEMSATLIEQGMSALTNIDGKGVKISMAKLGADFGIGVDDMAKGFDEGIKEMARAQIKILDAQIQFLEGIVALEALGDIDIDKNGTIDLTDVFDGDNFTKGYKEFQKGLEDNEKLKPLLEQWSIDGHTLMELFNMSEEELRAAGISKDRWVDAVNALYQISISDDYDLDKIPQSLRDIMATLGTGQWQFNNDTNTGWLFDFSGRQYTVTWDSDKEKQKLVDAFKKAGVNKTFEEASEIIKKGGQTGEFSSANERLAYELYFGNVDVTVDKSGKKTYKVKGSNETYENENDVLNALVGLDQKNRGAVSIDDNGKKYQLEAGLTYTAEVTAEGKTVYKVEGIDGEFTSYQDMINAVLQKETKDKYGEGKKFSDLSAEEQIEIKRKAKVLVTPSVELADSENGLTADQKANLTSILGKTEEEIQKLLEGKDAEVTYGIKLNPDSTGGFSKDELLALASANGIETKHLNIVATIVSEDEEIIKLLESEPATKDIVLNVTDVNYGPLSGDPNNPNSSLKLDVNNATSSLENLKQLVADITNVDWSNYNTLDELLADVVEKVEKIKTAVETFANQTFTVELNQTGTGTVNIDSTTDTSSIFDLVSSLDSAAQSVIKNIQEVIEALQGMSGTADALDKLGDALVKITDTQSKIATISSTLSTFSTKIDNIRRALGKIPTGTKSLAVKFSYSTSKSSSSSTATSVQTKTSGGSGGRDIQTKAVAVKGNQPAFAAGTPTLMGELGPELVVSNGHYFVVGQGGAEFVNLAKDAIVFNHRQTKKLLQNGSIGSRGIPFTNETNALSFAKGGLFGPALKAPTSNTSTNTNTTKTTVITKTSTESITGFNVSPLSHTLQLLSFAKGNAGPAMASASAALAQLKQIRAMWQSMLDASAKELGSLAGAGGGKKGGGGGKDWQEKTTTAEIQRWYNLIRQIAKLEEDITYQETLQSKLESDRVTNGKAMYKSYKQELAFLQQEIEANQELAALQKSWYDNKRAELAASDYGRIFTYDENGLQQYVGTGAPGSGLGLDILENLTRRDVYGQAMDNAATARQQLEYLRSVGFNTENLRFNDDGTFIDTSSLEGEELDNAYVQMMENFWDKVDGWRDELDSIYDSYHEQLEKVLSNEDKQNQILQKIVDNQLAVEQSVLNAIDSREQKRIDDAKDERDALADSTDKFLNGLSDQLNKEREMYQKQSEQDDLNKLRRQLAILMRSGGSSSQIRALQDQISAKSQDAYFDAQQEQIDTLKQASDAQLERLDTQIDLMTETLEYQKENGLLWQEVYEVMAQTPSQIQDFIMNNTPDFQSNSALQVAEDLRELKLQIEEWTEYRDDVAAGNGPMASVGTNWDTYYNSIKPLYGNVDSATLEKAREAYSAALTATGDPNVAASAAMAQLQQYQKVTPTPIVSSNYSSLLGGGGSTGAASEAEKVSNVVGLLKEGNKGNDVMILQRALNALGYTDNSGSALDVDGIFGSKTKQAVRKFQTAMGISSDGIVGDETKEKFRMKGYIKGGIVDYTGLAAVHGSESEPESFLNAAHTKLLIQDMALREQLLPSLLETYNNMLQNNTNRSILANSGETLNIERLELNMQIQQMNNDYDARRAAHAFKDELLSISRKSGNMSLNRG